MVVVGCKGMLGERQGPLRFKYSWKDEGESRMSWVISPLLRDISQ